MNARRLFVLNPDGRTVTRLPVGVTAEGHVVPLDPRGSGMRFDLRAIRERGLPLWHELGAVSAPVPTLSPIFSTPPPPLGGHCSPNTATMANTTSQVSNRTLTTPLQTAETTDGRAQVTRLGTKGTNVAGADDVLVFVFDNTGEQSATSFLIGDHATLIQEDRNIPVLPAGASASGTFGDRTLPHIKHITGPNPMEIMGMHIRSTKGTFPDEGKINVHMTKPLGQVTTSKINLAGRIRPDQRNTDILELRNFKMILDAYAACEVVVPAGEKITITTRLTDSAEGYNFLGQ